MPLCVLQAMQIILEPGSYVLHVGCMYVAGDVYVCWAVSGGQKTITMKVNGSPLGMPRYQICHRYGMAIMFLEFL